MNRTTRTALAGVPLSLALLLAGACSDDGDGDDAASTTTEASTTASTASTEATTASTEAETTTPSTPTTPPDTGSAPPPTEDSAPPSTEPESQAGDLLPTDSEGWASELIRAWGRGDRERAAELATPDAVDVLFGFRDPGGDDWTLDVCDGAAGTLSCTFTSPSAGRSVVTQQSAPNGVIEPIGEIAVE